jgi:hypothetical protein
MFKVRGEIMPDYDKLDKAWARELKRTLNPSGLVSLSHSEKCESYRKRETRMEEGKIVYDPGCTCAIRHRLTLEKIRKSKEWRGAELSYEGDYAILRHPSGAEAKIKLNIYR